MGVAVFGFVARDDVASIALQLEGWKASRGLAVKGRSDNGAVGQH